MQFGKDNIFELLQNVYSKKMLQIHWFIHVHDLIRESSSTSPSPLDANRDLTDWSGKKPLDYRKPKTTVSASTYSSEYSDNVSPSIPARTHSMVEKAHGRESSGFLHALTYPRRRGTASSLGHHDGSSAHEPAPQVDRQRRDERRRGRATTTTVIIPGHHQREADEQSLSSTDKSDSGKSLSRRDRNQQSFLRKKFGSMNKKKRSSYI